MSDLPRAELQKIHQRIDQVERGQYRLEFQMKQFNEGFDSRVELAVRKMLDQSGKKSRDTTSWIISIAMAVLVVLIGFAQVAVGLWG